MSLISQSSSERSSCASRGGVVLRVLLLLAAISVVVAWLVPDRVLRPIGERLYFSEQPLPGDAIVVLLGGDTPDRVLRAGELFREQLAPRIIVGSGFVDTALLQSAPVGFQWPPPSMRERLALASLGIGDEHIVTVNSQAGFDTEGELTAVSEHARREGWKRVLLVTSATHSWRASLIWKRVAPDIAGLSVPAHAGGLAEWWKHPRLVRTVGYEYGALVKEFCRRLMSR